MFALSALPGWDAFRDLPGAASAPHLLFLAPALAFLVVYTRLAARRAAPARRGAARSRGAGLLPVGVMLGFLGVYGYQATWQLAGFARPDFVGFMHRYNRRPDNPAQGVVRGRILDRNGLTLAESDVQQPRRRLYPQGGDFAHLVGYDHPVFGRAGIEAAEGARLDAAGLQAMREVERFGRQLLDHRAVRGNDVTLTVDAPLQATAMRLLGGRPGAVVALRPADGAVLVLASSPTFDPAHPDPAAAGRASAPHFHRALAGQYPPGSTFKLAVAAVAAERDFRDRIACPAEGYRARGGDAPIRDHEYYAAQRAGRTWAGYGPLGIEEALARSSNVFFAQLGVRMGGAALDEMMERFGLRTRLPLLRGVSGTLWADASSAPALGDVNDAQVAQVAIGQGRLTVTPFAMALLTAAIAHDGRSMQPRLRPEDPVLERQRVLSPVAARRLQQWMREVVERGTAGAIRSLDVPVAGKTGTAQTPAGADHAWFVCFAPVDRPAIALAVVVEHAGYGSAAALPIARELLRQADERGLLARDGLDGLVRVVEEAP